MRRSLLLACLVVSSLGCTRFAGPIAVRHMGRPDALAPDGTRYTIEEQKRRGRERLALPEDDIRVGPKLYADRPSPTGR